MNTARIQRALHRAREARALGPHSRPESRRERRVHVAMGDPQADVTKTLAVLEAHGLLGDGGWLREEVRLVSMGDHFDWGAVADRERATESGTLLLAWLASHPSDQVTLLLGNHDLARVGELVGHDDASFARIREEADRVYRGGEDEAAFLARHPGIASAELMSRDFSCFSQEQRQWVERLLRERRFRVAHAHGALLLTHAGVTVDELRGRVTEGASAREIAAALNAALDSAVDAWSGEPLRIPGLHRPGDGQREGVGIFYHRPSLRPEDTGVRGDSPPRRRFDPRRLPRGLTQVVGHIRDAKCLSLLEGNPREAWDGLLRHLWTDGLAVHYAHGVGEVPGADEAAMIFTDGGMRECPSHEYELLDLEARAPLAPLG